MHELKSASIGHGSVTYVPKEPAVPETSETQGHVTVNVAGRPERDAYWTVMYTISARFEAGDGPALGAINWEVRLPTSEPAETRYYEVEAKAARQLAPMLRAVADSIEKQVAEYDSDRPA
jgi:hypothetical protein